MASQGKIDRGFVDAGWEPEGGFGVHLVVGHDGNLSMLADRVRGMVRTSSTTWSVTLLIRSGTPEPQRAAELSKEYGEPPEEE